MRPINENYSTIHIYNGEVKYQIIIKTSIGIEITRHDLTWRLTGYNWNYLAWSDINYYAWFDMTVDWIQLELFGMIWHKLLCMIWHDGWLDATGIIRHDLTWLLIGKTELLCMIWHDCWLVKRELLGMIWRDGWLVKRELLGMIWHDGWLDATGIIRHDLTWRLTGCNGNY